MVLASPTSSAVSPPVIPLPTSPRSGRFRRLTYLRSHSHSDSHFRNQDLRLPAVQPSLNPNIQDITPDHGSNLVSRNGAPAVPDPSHPTGGWLPASQPTTHLQSAAATSLEPTSVLESAKNTGGMSRRRSATTPAASSLSQGHPAVARSRTGNTPQSASLSPPVSGAQSTLRSGTSHMPSIRFVNYQDGRASRPSLSFPTISRTLPHLDSVIRVGRYSEKDAPPESVGDGPSDAPVGFKSKVVSRRHCEFSFKDSHWWIKDTKSSSGTFLNRIRLSQPNIESKPYKLNDGDIVQLGIDFKGGEESIFRCVKIRIYCNKSWQQKKNNFNTSTHKQLQQLTKSQTSRSTETNMRESTDCTICLCAIAPCQALFIAPCSHTWHYKCIRPIINQNADYHYPEFLCPNCRAVADLEEDIEETEQWEGPETSDDKEMTGQSEADIDSGHPISDDNNDLDSAQQSEDEDLATEVGNLATQGTPQTQRSTGSKETGEPHDAGTKIPRSSPGALNPDASSFVPTPTLHNDPPPQLGRFSDWQLPGWQFSTSPQAHTRLISTSASSARHEEDVNDDSHTALANVRTVTGPDNEGPLTPRNNAGPFLFDTAPGEVEQEARSAAGAWS